MKQETTILHQLSPDDLSTFLRRSTEDILSYNPDRFYNVIIGADWFCKIHNISRTTLANWIKLGIVEPESGDWQTAKFRLSYVLRFDVDRLKHKKTKSKIARLHKSLNP